MHPFSCKLFCILSICCQFSYAQQMPLDFSDANDTFMGFGNSSFSFNTNPQDVNNDVGQFFNDGSEAYQGFYLDLNQSIDLDIEEVITLSFYAFDPNQHSILLKLENGVNPEVQVRQVFNVPSSSDWITLSFDFSDAQYSSDGSSVNASGTYNRLTIFIDDNAFVSGTYLIDDIDDGVAPIDPHELDVIYSDLVWSDEFETNGAINSSNWFQQTQLPSGGNWFNGEQQHYTDRMENSFVENGFLNIVAIKENFTDQGETKAYTSARLNSKFTFTYGRVDVRAKLPIGDGTWPAIWMLGKNVNEDGAYWDNQGFGTTGWPNCGEIDIMEHGLGATNHVSSALHSSCEGCFGDTMNTDSYILNDVANEYHVYSVNWSPDQITFLIDDVGFYTYNPTVKDNSNWPYFEDQYILLNIALGGTAGAIDPNFNQSSMVVDYVRVYQQNSLSVNDAFARKFKVFPNPASDVIKIATNEAISTVEVYDLRGQRVIHNIGHIRSINTSRLPSGMYLLKILSEENLVTIKVMIN